MKVPDVWITIGKRGFNKSNLIDLMYADVAGIRINTGRSTYPWIRETIKHLDTIGYPLDRILLDVGNTKPRLSLNNKEGLNLKKDDMIVISNREGINIDAILFSTPFFKNVDSNDIVYFGDGGVEGFVEDVANEKIIVRILNSGHLSEAVSIGIKGKNLFRFYISEEEIYQINNLLDCYSIQLILSFVENAENIKWAKKRFPKAYSIIPKVETLAAIRDIDRILELSNCIFIGRGDLGLSIGVEKIGIVQQILIDKAHQAGCKVSLGTDTLTSLKWNEIPLRAEISDITNSCKNGVDIIALTSETGGSATPFKAIKCLNIILEYLKTV